MTLYDHATLVRSPDARVTLAALAAAVGEKTVAGTCRVVASNDSRNPEEGLALLDAYISIADPLTRQAVLDTVLAIAGTNPYRRDRQTSALAAVDSEA